MFQIVGKEQNFKQWDLEQLVTCECLKEGDAVVFSGHGKTYETTAFVQNGMVVADVPNFLLQKAGTFRVDLGWGLDCHMDCRTTFTVEVREQPDDYECNYNIKQRETAKGSGVSSWNDLTDKPFGETTVMGDTLTWDGNTEGLVSVEVLGTRCWRISDATPTIEDCVNGVIYRYNDGDIFNMPYDQIRGIYESIGALSIADGVMVAHSDNCSIDATGSGNYVTFPKSGIYQVGYGKNDYIESITIPGYNGFKTTVIKPIDTKYLPEHLQFGESENAVLLPKTEFIGGMMEGALVAMGAVVELVEGKTYTVNWNGVDYETECFMGASPIDGSAVLFLGNPAALGLLNNNLPFAIAGNEDGLAAIPLDGSTSANVSIKGYGIVPVPIQYLTNALPYCIKVTGSGTAENPYFCNATVREMERACNDGRQIVLRTVVENGDLIAEFMYRFTGRHRMNYEGDYEYGAVYTFVPDSQLATTLDLVPNAYGTYNVKSKL